MLLHYMIVNPKDTHIAKVFLNEKFVFSIIILNAFVIFVQETGVNNLWLNCIDILCTIIFTIEMIVKWYMFGTKGYWHYGWNKLDGTLVILSVPSLISYAIPSISFNISFLFVLRLLRVFRFFRIFHLFPNFSKIVKNLKLAFRQSFSVFLGFGVLILVFTLITCALFRDISPTYFGTPMESLYSIFRICTIEGWYEIPNSVAENSPIWALHFVRIYFVGILVTMGLIGMSIINSIFVDAMVSDNNDEVLKKLEDIETQINNLYKNQ